VTGARRLRVAIVQHSIRRYRAPFFEALRGRLDAAGVQLRLLHSDDPDYLLPSPEKAALQWVEVHPGRRVHLRGSSLLWQPVLRATRRADLVIVEQASYLLANYPLLARQALGGPRVAFWGHGRNFLVAPTSATGAERVKAALSRRAHWWFAYNDRAAAVVTASGVPPERVTVVDNATDTRSLAAAVDAVGPDELAAMRSALGLRGQQVGLFVGTLGAVKRFDYLFAAAELVRAQLPDFELVIAGNGLEQPVVEAWAAERPWAHFAGPRFDAALAPLLALASVLLVPAWAGLVVVDSFGAGVPLVASAALPHPPEISYIEPGRNGLLVNDDGDPAGYAAAVVALLQDEQRRAALVRGCQAARERYSVERMAERFSDGVLRALDESASAARG
jgi:L-malate glycosyltransferase